MAACWTVGDFRDGSVTTLRCWPDATFRRGACLPALGPLNASSGCSLPAASLGCRDLGLDLRRRQRVRDEHLDNRGQGFVIGGAVVQRCVVGRELPVC